VRQAEEDPYSGMRSEQFPSEHVAVRGQVDLVPFFPTLQDACERRLCGD
jgi:hypothetical protein